MERLVDYVALIGCMSLEGLSAAVLAIEKIISFLRGITAPIREERFFAKVRSDLTFLYCSGRSPPHMYMHTLRNHRMLLCMYEGIYKKVLKKKCAGIEGFSPVRVS